MGKWRVFALRGASSLIWGGWEFAVPFYFVQDCRSFAVPSLLSEGAANDVGRLRIRLNKGRRTTTRYLFLFTLSRVFITYTPFFILFFKCLLSLFTFSNIWLFHSSRRGFGALKLLSYHKARTDKIITVPHPLLMRKKKTIIMQISRPSICPLMRAQYFKLKIKLIRWILYLIKS